MDRFFDTHAHLTRPEFAGDLDAVVQRARDAGVSILTAATDLPSSEACVELSARYENVYAAVGIHPNDVDEAGADDIARLRTLASHAKTLALGETGLDYYWKRTAPQTQRAFLEKHLQLADDLGLAVVLHARQSEDDLLDAVEPFCRGGGRAVWHCFLSNKKQIRARLDRALDMGLFLGLGGMVTFEDQKPLRETVPLIPDRHLVLETDCPFLCPRPVPPSGKRNEPARVVRVADELAALRGVTPADIARITSRNARILFAPPVADEQSDRERIAYPIRNSLYLNFTNACNNNCSFCARNQGYVVKGHDIRLDHDPDAAELLEAMGDFTRYDEVVFCGFGEPTLRLEVMKEVARAVKAAGQTVRLNTNGLANLEHGRDIVPELVGLVDVVSVSLNTADPAQYARLCRPRFGDNAFEAVCDFVRRCVQLGFTTVCTAVEMPEIDIDAARDKAAELGASFRSRSFVDAG